MATHPPSRGNGAHPAAAAPYWRGEIGRALQDGEFWLAYQPKYSSRTGRIDSFEGLLRWNHPEDGEVMPDRFIEPSENSGCITAITLWTADRAIADQRDLRAKGHDVRLFINLSAQLLTDESVVGALLERASQSGGDIGVEITEQSVIQEPDLAFANIRRLRAAGLNIAIDDYGSGLSSLTYLKQIEADELKIDKSFIISLGTSHRDPLIVRSTIDLAHALDMQVTAEGVETRAAQALLAVMGCDMMQGYLIGRPMPVAEVPRYISDFRPGAISTTPGLAALRDRTFWQHAV